MKRRPLSLIIAAILVAAVGAARQPCVWAQTDDDRAWRMTPRKGRYFYFARGQEVRGQEFGFFKDPADCSVDTLWLTLDASLPGVHDYQGRDVTLAVDVGGEVFELSVPLVNVGSTGFAYVLMFTNHEADQELLAALSGDGPARVRIAAPEELAALLDAPVEEFSLDGFAVSRKAAADACRDDTQGQGDESS